MFKKEKEVKQNIIFIPSIYIVNERTQPLFQGFIQVQFLKTIFGFINDK